MNSAPERTAAWSNAPPGATSATVLKRESSPSQNSSPILFRRAVISPWPSQARRGKMTHFESLTNPSSGSGRANV